MNDFFQGFFQEVFSYTQYLNTQAQDYKKQVEQTTVLNFPGKDLINKYYFLFVNNEKKRAYLKNQFLK